MATTARLRCLASIANALVLECAALDRMQVTG
jgi:hypothetical protein